MLDDYYITLRIIRASAFIIFGITQLKIYGFYFDH
jgi:hypothetical protein